GSSAAVRDGSSPTVRDGSVAACSHQVGVPPQRLDFAGVNSRRTAGAARTPDGILGDSQNPVRHKMQCAEFTPAASARLKEWRSRDVAGTRQFPFRKGIFQPGTNSVALFNTFPFLRRGALRAPCRHPSRCRHDEIARVRDGSSAAVRDGSSAAVRDGSSPTVRDGSVAACSHQVGVPPQRLDFAGVNSRCTAGGARTPDGILGDFQNSVRHKEQRGEFSPGATTNFQHIGPSPVF
ncbi:hypothetical protein, partial [Herbaspirillum sp.]|uniref:hypothetical protein n=1 Tax=Herbaspirillum sp. TaxID=1890675 RepID=UPI00258CB5B3